MSAELTTSQCQNQSPHASKRGLVQVFRIGLLLVISFAVVSCADDGSDGISGSNGNGSTSNQPPMADAGSDQSVNKGATVTLDGTGSSDPDGDAITYAWAQTSGTPVTLSDTTAAQPAFTAPGTADTLGFSLVVNDGLADSGADTVTI